MNSHIDYWLKEKEQRKKRSQKLAQTARKILPSIVQCLVKEFSASKIILFGSLLTEKFDHQSDIDLAVAGIKSEAYFAALARVNDISNFTIDLKPLEDLEPHFLAKVLRKGECLYEKHNA